MTSKPLQCQAVEGSTAVIAPVGWTGSWLEETVVALQRLAGHEAPPSLARCQRACPCCYASDSVRRSRRRCTSRRRSRNTLPTSTSTKEEGDGEEDTE